MTRKQKFAVWLTLLCVIAVVAYSQTVKVTASGDPSLGLTAGSKSAVTTAVNVKASAGNVYGVFFLNGAVSGCWLELIDNSGNGSLGTGVLASIPMASAGSQLLTFNPPIGPFASGIAVGSASAVGGASACGTAATGVVVLYK